MKQILLFVILFLTQYFAFAQERAPVGEAWRLMDNDKNGMLDRLNECGIFKPCRNNSKVVDPDNDEYKWIVATYGNTATISMVEARYRNDDEARYKKLRGITDEAKGKVRGFKTIIVKVQQPRKLGAEGETIYYDCFTLCPPPDTGCGM